MIINDRHNLRPFAPLIASFSICVALLLLSAPSQAELIVTIGKGKSAISISDNSAMDLDPAGSVIKFDIDGKSGKKKDGGYDLSGIVSLLPGGSAFPGGSILSLSDFEASNPKGAGKGKLMITFSDTVFGPAAPIFAADSISGSFQGGAGSSLSFQGFVDKAGIGSTFSASTKKGGKGPILFSDVDTATFSKGGPPWDLTGVLTVEVGKGDKISLPGSAQVAIGVPEPGALALLSLGSLGIVAYLWRRRRT
jgi:hypothetical protein